MITKTQSFQTSDGEIHASFEVAQEYELCLLLSDIGLETKEIRAGVADFLIRNSEKVIDILSSKPRKPRTSKGTKSAKAKPTAAPAAK